MSANELRGEVDLVLNETRFVLRPSFEAIVTIEKETGKSMMGLLSKMEDADLSLSDAAIITTQMIKAWGKETGDQTAQNVDVGRIGQLIHEVGLMNVVLRLALVVGNAVTGGCRADGTFKSGEGIATGTKTTATPAANSPGSRPPPSSGRRKSSGGQRRTSSGRATSNGGKSTGSTKRRASRPAAQSA